MCLLSLDEILVLRNGLCWRGLGPLIFILTEAGPSEGNTSVCTSLLKEAKGAVVVVVVDHEQSSAVVRGGRRVEQP